MKNQRVSDIVFTNQNLDAGGKLVLGAVCGSEHVLGADDAASAPWGPLFGIHQADLMEDAKINRDCDKRLCLPSTDIHLSLSQPHPQSLFFSGVHHTRASRRNSLKF